MSGYQPGFLNHFATEAIEGALPVGRNSPQRPAFGLYAEQFSTTAFTMPRAQNRRSWLYRMRPTAAHRPFEPVDLALNLRSAPFADGPGQPKSPALGCAAVPVRQRRLGRRTLHLWRQWGCVRFSERGRSDRRAPEGGD